MKERPEAQILEDQPWQKADVIEFPSDRIVRRPEEIAASSNSSRLSQMKGLGRVPLAGLGGPLSAAMGALVDAYTADGGILDASMIRPG